jgi:ribosomal-protein-alanine N-acetyltransferase
VKRAAPVSGVRLREIEPDDLDALWRLDQACFEPGVAYSKPELRFLLARPDTVALAADRDGSLSGFAVGHRSGAKGHIVTVDVADSERRRGVGRTLLSETLRRLERAGAREIRLEVDPRNAAAIRLYESFGFHRGRELKGYYGRGRDGLEMRRELKPKRDQDSS